MSEKELSKEEVEFISHQSQVVVELILRETRGKKNQIDLAIYIGCFVVSSLVAMASKATGMSLLTTYTNAVELFSSVVKQRLQFSFPDESCDCDSHAKKRIEAREKEDRAENSPPADKLWEDIRAHLDSEDE